MLLTEEQINGLNVACNEAQWIGLEINEIQSWVGITLAVLSLPSEGVASEDSRVQLIFQSFVRLCASHRAGLWNDENAEVLSLTKNQLERRVVELQAPIFGWDFFNIPDETGFSPWANRLSIQIGAEAQEPVNTINLFQDTDPVLDVRIWFGELRIFGPDRKEISFQDFSDGGRRWWEAMYAGDSRTKDSGIFPLA
ncbi:MAG TPA: hypothetical protein V6C81_30260 [Planktothrix sp.]|jgi:hypothetical protein